MKRSLVILILGLFSTGLLMATNIDNGNKGKKERLAKLAEKLELTEQQKAQIQPIMEKYKAQAEQIKETYKEKSEKRKAMKVLKEDMRAEIEPYLTVDQIAKWEQIRAERKERKGKGKRGEGQRGQGRG